MKRRKFIKALGSAVLVPGLLRADDEEDAAILKKIDEHRPSRLKTLSRDFAARVGATHVAGKYHFTGQPFLIEGAEKLIDLGTRLGKFWFMPQGAARDYPFNSAWPSTRGFVELAKTAYFEQLFAMPFRTIILEAHLPQENGPWKKEQPQSYHDEITREFHELTTHLYQTFQHRDVTIILQHWEGDWLLRGRGGERWDPPPENWPKLCERMARWLAARQAGVSKAREEFLRGKTTEASTAQRGAANRGPGSTGFEATVRCRVAHAAEVNRVLDAHKGIPTMTTRVLPQVELDLVSYSSYDAMSSAVTLWKAIEEIRRHARTGPLFGPRAVFLGEIGIPENERPERLRDRWDESLGVMLALNVPYFVHWELYCNELNPRRTPIPKPPVKNNDDVRGFFLVRPDGTLSVSGEFFQGLWRRAGA